MILVVDDAPLFRRIMSIVLGQMGFGVDEAYDCQSALQKLQTDSYALIFLDCNMPVASGYECAERIRAFQRERGSRVPIIGRSASTNNELRRLCLEAGMDDYLDKTCTLNELEEMLNKWTTQLV